LEQSAGAHRGNGPPRLAGPGFFSFLVVNRWAAIAATLASTAVLALGLWGYLAHQASQRALESYMNDYLRDAFGDRAAPTPWRLASGGI